MTEVRQDKELSGGKSYILTQMATDYKFCKYLMQNVKTTDNNTRIGKEEYEYEKEPRENKTN